MDVKNLPKHTNPFFKCSPCRGKFDACPIAYEKQTGAFETEVTELTE
jgi:hypothetical protein